MEFVEGTDIEDYLTQSPEKINELFLQAINGFRYLEANNILHRDIRPKNILIRKDGTLKIIDLGFGKFIENSEDFDKSISLNWWCEPPKEFKDGLYDFRSEIYFVGKLFAQIIQDRDIAHFNYRELLRLMCHRDPEVRVQSFREVERQIQSDKFFEIDFEEDELNDYREFADRMAVHITKIESGAKYRDDIERVEAELEDVYRNFMLEEKAPDAAPITRCFINGAYYYKSKGFPVDAVKQFLHLLKSATLEKKRIILANLQTRFDAITRYSVNEPDDDEIPF
jgi:serine/threonine protein kinase